MIDYEYADLFYGSHAKTWIFTCIDPDVQLTFSNDDIVQESISLERGMCETDFFAYGTYSSNSIRVSVFKTEEQFKGKRFLVDVVLDNHTEAPLTVGTFTCESDNLSSDRRSRELVMYDDLYKLSELDVASWYNHFFDTDEPVYMAQFRTSFFEDCLHLDCELADSQGTALSADFMQIKKAANYRTLMASTVLKSILVANCVNGMMTNINKFRFVRIKEYDMHMAPPDPHWDIIPDIVLDNSKFYNCNYEEYQVLYVDGMRVVIDPDNVIIPVIPTHDLPAVDNTLDISYDNMFFRDIETSEITSMLAANYDKIHHRISFTPARIQLRGNLCYEPGDVVQVDIDGKTIYTVIIKQTITGVQGLTMTLSCQGDERFSNPLSVESASYDDYAGAENQSGDDATHSNTAWKLRSAPVDAETGERYYTYLTQNKHFIVSNDEEGGHTDDNDRTNECTIGQKAHPWFAGYFENLFVNGQKVGADTGENFPEIVRNIGYRLLDEPTDITIYYDGLLRTTYLKWKDPNDISTNKPVPATWAGTVVVRKKGVPPLNRWDGTTLIIDSTTRNAYQDTLLQDTNPVENDSEYYYGIFPYDTRGWYRFTKSVFVVTIPKLPPHVTQLEVDGTNVTGHYALPLDPFDEPYSWEYVKLVYKKESLPESVEDGRLVNLNLSDSSFTVGDLAEDTLYFFRIFSQESSSMQEFADDGMSIMTGLSGNAIIELITANRSGLEYIEWNDEIHTFPFIEESPFEEQLAIRNESPQMDDIEFTELVDVGLPTNYVIDWGDISNVVHEATTEDTFFDEEVIVTQI